MSITMGYIIIVIVFIAQYTISFTHCTLSGQHLIQMFIHLPMEKIIACRYENNKELVHNIKERVYAETGIPTHLQNLYNGYKQMHDGDMLSSDGTQCTGHNLYIKLKLLGGNLECDICYSKGEFRCSECNEQVTCKECCNRLHQHPKRENHQPSPLHDTTTQPDNTGISDHMEYDIDSPETSSLFEEAAMVMTLAERFSLTKFKAYQKDVIGAILSGRDCLVIHPTGSGKSLCYQFPAVYENKKTIVVTPTISLMQDQVTNCEESEISAIFLGSAQLDLTAESRALSSEGKENVIYVTPEWMAKPGSVQRIQTLVAEGRLSMIAIDEAHLYHQWQEFRPAYKELEKLKSEFPTIPIMCLTATAPPTVEVSIRKLLRDPLVSKASIDRPNVYLACEEMPHKANFEFFASRVSEMLLEPSCSIIYTDFIDSIGPIMNHLNSYGLDSVAYYGEMDAKSRKESYQRWRSGDVHIMVATSAFGMGVNKANIRNIIRYGVPENVCSWAQELGRAGRDGNPSKATIFYTMSNTEHASAWIRGKINDHSHCSEVLEEFSQSWKYTMSHLAQKCRREMLLSLFGELGDTANDKYNCCDVCRSRQESGTIEVDCTSELVILYDAIDILGARGEVKLTQWIRGSSLSWTNSFNKMAFSYGNCMGHSEMWWRIFMRKCHVLGCAQRKLVSLIKESKHYSIQGIICKTARGEDIVKSGKNFSIMQLESESCEISDFTHTKKQPQALSSACSPTTSKRVRKGKGTHSITIIKKLMEDKENWQRITDKKQYQFPGNFDCRQRQRMLYSPDCRELVQSCSNMHFLWDDIQLSKGSWNKDRDVSISIDGVEEHLLYRIAPCNGVKFCPHPGCDYTVSVSTQRPCHHHTEMKLVRSSEKSTCMVQFAYIYPKDLKNDHRRWITGFIQQQKEDSFNLHNHPMPCSSKVCSIVKDLVTHATNLNPTIKPSDIARGQGLPVIPGVIDKASNHLGRLASIVKKAKKNSLAGSEWNIESVANEIDAKDNSASGEPLTRRTKIQELSRPYLVSAGIDNGISFIFCMNPFMSTLLSKAQFIEADITYNETIEYPYLFNITAFDYTMMEWVVVCRVRMNKQDSSAYGLAFSKLFSKCKCDHAEFEVGKTLQGVVIDWSEAEMKGLGIAVGSELAKKLLRGCSVHWIRSWQRIRDRIASSADKQRERSIFSKIASQIEKLPSGTKVCLCFQVLCGEKPASALLGTIKSLSAEDATYIEKHCKWSPAKHWAEWWIKPHHLQMLHKDFSEMEESVWESCPTTTNAVERKNKDSHGKTPLPLQSALINLYKLDKAVCAKHTAASEDVSTSYYDRSEAAQKTAAATRSRQRSQKYPKDTAAVHSPPDRQCHFQKRRYTKTSYY